MTSYLSSEFAFETTTLNEPYQLLSDQGQSQSSTFSAVCYNALTVIESITESSFVSTIASYLPLSKDSISLLFRYLQAYAAFPFPSASLPSTLNCPSFQRAFVVMRYLGRISSRWSFEADWGPYKGWAHSGRPWNP